MDDTVMDTAWLLHILHAYVAWWALLVIFFCIMLAMYNVMHRTGFTRDEDAPEDE